MTQSALFCRGIELASFLTSSAVLLRKPWDVIKSRYAGIITTEGEGISWKVFREPGLDLTILAFDVTQDSSKLQSDLVPSNARGEKNFHHFEFLHTEKAPFFSVNSTAISLLDKNYEQLDQLKSEINTSLRLIVTGLGLGGLMASLFTLSLLDTNDHKKKLPLCITFGSPLVGDKKLQEAISRSSKWSSCFLHVVSYKDPLLRKLNPHTTAYMPFGTFLFCSDISSTCFEIPKSVLELLMISNNNQNQAFQPIDYGNIVENLYNKAICKEFTPRGQDFTESDSLRASICLQLWAALGLTPDMQQQHHQNIDMKALVTALQRLEKEFIFQKRRRDTSRKLNIMKMQMAMLEWYMKSAKQRDIGYYDSYKRMAMRSDQDALVWHIELKRYWKQMVEEAKISPQKASAPFRQSWIHAGTSYRRMVEPLDIALYYIDGGKDYVTENRPEHFVLLEQWHRQEMTKANTSNEEGIRDWDCSWNWDFYWDWHRIVDKYLPSSQGLMVDEEREDKSVLSIKSDHENGEAISSATGYSSRINQLLLSTNGSNHEENEENVNTTSKNNDKNNSYYKACVDELLLSCQGSDKEQKINKFESHVDEAVLSRQGSFAVKDLQEFFNRTKKRNTQTILTSDSCFWAHVEEALISCNVLKVIKEKEKTSKKLVEFEEYVYELLEKYEVSSDIFLQGSSYMYWWNEYKAIKGPSYDSKLANFMNNVRNYEQYALGDYDFP